MFIYAITGVSLGIARGAIQPFVDTTRISLSSCTRPTSSPRCRCAFRVPQRVSALRGDHIIFIGHVERYAYTAKPALLFYRGKYMRGEPLIPA